MSYIFIVHSSVNRLLGCFHFQNIVNITTINKDVEYKVLCIYIQETCGWVLWQTYFLFHEEISHWFLQWLHQLGFPPAVNKCFCFPPPEFVIILDFCLFSFHLFNLVIRTEVRWNLKVVLVLIFLLIEDVQNF